MKDHHEHILTFDVEHWYEGYRQRGIPGWESKAPRDPIIVDRLLDLLASHDQTATFFFTGRFAAEFPQLVRRSASLGHEVASHSYEHRLIDRIGSRQEFRRDLRASLDLLADLCGEPVVGYRAPKWSVTPKNEAWVLPMLVEEGLRYDSSFFPAPWADARRCRGRPFWIDLPGGRQILEIPASCFNLGPVCIPVGSGVYFRAYPRWVTLAMLRQKARRGLRGMVSVHPYDLDLDSPMIGTEPIAFRLFRTYGVRAAWPHLSSLVTSTQFTSIRNWMQSVPLGTVMTSPANFR